MTEKIEHIAINMWTTFTVDDFKKELLPEISGMSIAASSFVPNHVIFTATLVSHYAKKDQPDRIVVTHIPDAENDLPLVAAYIGSPGCWPDHLTNEQCINVSKIDFRDSVGVRGVLRWPTIRANIPFTVKFFIKESILRHDRVPNGYDSVPHLIELYSFFALVGPQAD